MSVLMGHDGAQWCTDIITRDKIEAKADSKR